MNARAPHADAFEIFFGTCPISPRRKHFPPKTVTLAMT